MKECPAGPAAGAGPGNGHWTLPTSLRSQLLSVLALLGGMLAVQVLLMSPPLDAGLNDALYRTREVASVSLQHLRGWADLLLVSDVAAEEEDERLWDGSVEKEQPWDGSEEAAGSDEPAPPAADAGEPTSGLSRPRGLHWRRMRALREVRVGDAGEDDPSRLSRRWSNPAVEDDVGAYLAFPEEAVQARYASLPRLVYDVRLFRVTDDFGIVDDNYTLPEVEAVFREVVAIYARLNVYVRVSRDELANRVRLGRQQSLETLAYSEGPDHWEAVETAKGERARHRFDERELAYNAWFRAEYRKAQPALMLWQAQAGGRAGGVSPSSFVYKRRVMDWALGFPHLLTPWELVHTTPIFTLNVFHGLNGGAMNGRVFGRTGSCWLPPRRLVDRLSGQPVRNTTCRGFTYLAKRARLGARRVFRSSEKHTMYGLYAARMWAHELGHSMTLQHSASTCKRPPRWSDNNLMLQLRHVGKKGVGCPVVPIDEQAEGNAWFGYQADQVRAFVAQRDLRPSPALPGALTVGESTMQEGAAGPSFLARIGREEPYWSRSATKLLPKRCALPPQHALVFTQLPSPADGHVRRVRWMPAVFRDKPSIVRLAVVEPGPAHAPEPQAAAHAQPDAHAQTGRNYTVVARSAPLEVLPRAQRMHVELHLDQGLPMRRGQLLVLLSADQKPLQVDSQRYLSDNVLYADVIGHLPKTKEFFLDAALQPHLSDVEVAYPKVLVARPRADAFAFAGAPVEDANVTTLLARGPRHGEEPCTPLIFNYDLVLDDNSSPPDAPTPPS